MAHPQKERIIQLVNQLLLRSGLSISQVVARMQAHGCDITRTKFENRFTTRADKLLNIPPEWTVALIAALTRRLSPQERCTATEAIELARLSRLPIDRFSTLSTFFPAPEFNAAYGQVAPPDTQPIPAAPPRIPTTEKSFDLVLTCHPQDKASVDTLVELLTRAGLTCWPTPLTLSPNGGWPDDLPPALAAGRVWLVCVGRNQINDWLVAELHQPPPVEQQHTEIMGVLLPGTRRSKRCILPRFLQTATWATLNQQPLTSTAIRPLITALNTAIGDKTDPTNNNCPYQGLQAFDETDAPYFFGRNHEIEWLAAELADTRFLAVLGPSGSGKSSLVRAGLLPALRRGAVTDANAPDGTTSANWLIQTITPGRHPLHALAGPLAGLVGRSRDQVATELASAEQSLHLLNLETLEIATRHTRVVWVVDQFEELYTLCASKTERNAFINNLLYAAAAPYSHSGVIITMRADFYSQAATHPQLAAFLSDNQFLVSPMTETGLQQVIVKPAFRVGLHLESGLVVRLLQDADAEPGALPLLEYTLLELWRQRQGNLLTLAAYQESGGVHGALAQRADQLFEQFSTSQQAIMRRVMLRLTHLGDGAVDTRRRVSMAELIRNSEEENNVREVIKQLADARLVTTNFNAEENEETVEVAHEALIKGWPRLQNWLQANRDSLRFQQQLGQASRDWQAHQKESSYLYRGARLAAAEEWAAAHPDELSQLEQEFVVAGLAVRNQETARREKQRRRVMGGLAVGLVLAVIGLVITVGLALYARNQQQQVETQQQLTLSRQLAALADKQQTQALDKSLLLAVEASNVADTFAARSSLLSALVASPHLDQYLRGHTGWVMGLAVSPNGQTIASGSADGTIRLWDVDTRRPLGDPLTGHSGWVRTVAFAPNGKMLASAGDDGQIIIWDADTGQQQGNPLTGHTSFIIDVAFNPAGNMLASASADGTVRLWDVATGQPVGEPLLGHTSFVLSVDFSPDGQMLASGGADDQAILWEIADRQPGMSLATGQPLAYALPGHEGDVLDVAFMPTGGLLATASEDKTIILWNLNSRRAIGKPFTGHTGPVNTLAFSPDGQLLVSGSSDGTLRQWSMQTAKETGQPLRGHTADVLNVAFGATPDGHPVFISSGADNNVILWDMDEALPVPAKMLPGQQGTILALDFSPNSQHLASAGGDGNILIHNLSGQPPLTTSLRTSHQENITELDFSPDGKLLLSAGYDGKLTLWDVERGQPQVDLNNDPAHNFLYAKFSPDGKFVAALDCDQALMVWDVTSEQLIWSVPLDDCDAVAGLEFSPDGKLLALGNSTGEIIFWDVETREQAGLPLAGHDSAVGALEFGPDDALLASGDVDGNLYLWDMSARELSHKFTAAHTSPIINLALSPDGKTLVTVGSDQIRLWDVTNRQPYPALNMPEATFRNAVFSPNGQYLAISTATGETILWNFALDTWRSLACDITTRNLNENEWAQQAVDQPYHQICPGANPLPEFDTTLDEQPSAATPPDLEQPLPSGSTAKIVEPFNSGQGYVQTSNNVAIEEGQVRWSFKRNGGKQFVYRNIPPFSGNVRLTVHGQIDSWTNNCWVFAGLGDQPGTGIGSGFGYLGGGCDSGGPVVMSKGVALDHYEKVACEYSGNWQWIEAETPYTTTLTITNGEAVLTTEGLEGVNPASGPVRYEGAYTTFWVGNHGRGDWPECNGSIDTVIIEPFG